MRSLSLHPGVWTGFLGLEIGGATALLTAAENAIGLQAVGWISVAAGIALALWGLKYQERHWWQLFRPWLRENVTWRFGKSPPRLDSSTCADEFLPDIRAEELISRIMASRQSPDDGSPASLETARGIGNEIADAVSVRGLRIWLRAQGALIEPPDDIPKTGMGVGRDTQGNLVCLKTYPISEDEKRNVDDIRFSLTQAKSIWPDV